MIGVGLRVWPPTKKCASLIGSTSRFSSDGINDWNLFANARVRFCGPSRLSGRLIEITAIEG
jgi:hypothetical protein